jgi:XTP/dITP diphosphohydrolase
VVEDADTFAGNATKKAVELARWIAGKSATPHFVLADDSGLEVDALNGAPGVHSARFAALDQGAGAAGNSPDADNNAKLLRLLKDVPLAQRAGRFRCVLALVPVPEERVTGASPVCFADEFAAQTFEGACEGRIQFAASGHGGFGYDPLFVPSGHTQSFAELGEEVKNRLSHRAQALEKLKRFFGRQMD